MFLMQKNDIYFQSTLGTQDDNLTASIIANNFRSVASLTQI